MTFRSRLLLACVPLTVAPIALVAFGVRREVNERVSAQYDARVDGMARVIADDLERESRAIDDRLASLSAMLEHDNRLRLQLLGADAGDRRYLLDYAGDAMRLAGLDVLQLHDEGGRILSSGHFRNDFDRADPSIVRALRAAGGRAVAEVRTADRTFPALLRVSDLRIGGRTFALVGGTALDATPRDTSRAAAPDRGFLSSLDRGAGLSIALDYPGGHERPTAVADRQRAGRGREGSGMPATALVREIELPFVTGPPSTPSSENAALVITQSLEPLHELRRSIDRWFLIVTGTAVFVALALASWAAARLSRPLADLARRTRRLDLDRLDVDFRNDRRDEVGTLSRTLDALTGRLRASVSRLREAERRAAIGDIARQVNHDVRNGLTPIRNVMSHLAEVARNSPAELPDVFRDRQQTLDASVDYLQSLAGNYARLSPRTERSACDVAASIRELLNGLPEPDRSRVRLDDHGASIPPVNTDPVALRRILENVVTNALESLESSRGRVVISATRQAQSVRIVITDNGRGMSADQVSRIFDDFYTTKERGTGLGLSIVRRLVNDLRGSIAVDSEPGSGTRFTVDFPMDGAMQEPAEAAARSAPRLGTGNPAARKAAAES